MRITICFLSVFIVSLCLADDLPPIRSDATGLDATVMMVGGHIVRLWGIDAPDKQQYCLDEKDEPYECGLISAYNLADLVAKNQPITCYPKYEDRYNRSVSICTLPDGRDVAEYMVRNGYAIDWEKVSHGYYQAAQQFAMEKKQGLWQGKFINP